MLVRAACVSVEQGLAFLPGLRYALPSGLLKALCGEDDFSAIPCDVGMSRILLAFTKSEVRLITP